MDIDLSTISPKPGDTIIVTLSDRVPQAVAVGVKFALSGRFPGIQCLVVTRGTDIALVDEAQMRSLGWQRATSDVHEIGSDGQCSACGGSCEAAQFAVQARR